jgi:hypothetical protein
MIERANLNMVLEEFMLLLRLNLMIFIQEFNIKRLESLKLLKILCLIKTIILDVSKDYYN